MKLRHKKYRSKVMEVTDDQWDKMREIGAANKWEVTDATKTPIKRVEMPEAIKEFINDSKKKRKK